jgi:phosphopantothenoylcysteine decarboxylase/phosphopantothenate--cysteine ligase
MTTRRSVRKPADSRRAPQRRALRNADRPVRVLVTAGPTYEPIDSVRFIGNRSSGAMGIAIAQAFAGLGHPCTLLLGPTSLTSLHSSVKVKRFRTTADLERLLGQEFPHCDVLVMAAAVADYRPPPLRRAATGKIARSRKGLTLRLEPTPDLVAAVATRRKPGQTVVGFALEPEATMRKRAAGKLMRKGLDLIVANPLETMESPHIRAVVLGVDGPVLTQLRPTTKRAFAKRLAALVIAHHRATLTQ